MEIHEVKYRSRSSAFLGPNPKVSTVYPLIHFHSPLKICAHVYLPFINKWILFSWYFDFFFI